MQLVEEQTTALPHQTVQIPENQVPQAPAPDLSHLPNTQPTDAIKFERWKRANAFEQKQAGFYGVFVKLPLGNMPSDQARSFAKVAKAYAADDIRITVNQGYLLRFVSEKALVYLFNELNELALAEPGFDSPADITACPGTDTCNLGISSSTGAASALEQVIRNEYPDLIFNRDIKIKISGCPNSCGQHGLASIGFHGSSIKVKGKVMPALQVLLGGGVLGNGEGKIAEKVIKLPSKRTPDALRFILDDYETHATDGEYYSSYFDRQGKIYFYDLLKPLAQTADTQPTEYLDFGSRDPFEVFKAVGECAGVIIDLVSTLFLEAEEKLGWALQSSENGKPADSLYHSYAAMVHAAKGLLLTRDVVASTQAKVLGHFDEEFTEQGLFSFPLNSLKSQAFEINNHSPSDNFAKAYYAEALKFVESAKVFHASQDQEENQVITA